MKKGAFGTPSKLLKHMVDLEAKEPTKLTPEQEKEIQKIIKGEK
jgi:hypothetical protein